MLGTLRAMLVAAAFFTAVSSAAAQATRAEQIAELQAVKATSLAPEGPNKGEKVVTRVMSSPLLTGAGGVYPWFGSVYAGTGFGTGVGVLSRQPRGGSASAVAAAAVSGSLLFDTAWVLPALTESESLQARVDASWLSAKGIAHYGVGPTTRLADRMRFDYEPTTVTGTLEARVAQRLRLSVNYGYLHVSTALHQADAPLSALPALGESIHYGVAGASAVFDWRSSRGYSTGGGMLRASWARYDANGGGRFSFDRFEYEAAQLVPLLREQYVLAFRVLATEVDAEPGHEVPFVLLPSVGGGSTVRGLENGRFHDRSRLATSAEYRWRPSRFLDMALFIDGGAVAPRLTDLSQSTFSTAWGLGARLHGPSFTALRVDVAHSGEGWVTVVGASQPF